MIQAILASGSNELKIFTLVIRISRDELEGLLLRMSVWASRQKKNIFTLPRLGVSQNCQHFHISTQSMLLGGGEGLRASVRFFKYMKMLVFLLTKNV